MYRAVDLDEYLSDVPDDGQPIGLKVLRVPAKGNLGGVCLSDKPLIRGMHFWGGKSVPHYRENCKACAEAVELRYKGWVALYSLKTATIGIAECTPPALKALNERIKSHGTLRGAMIVLSRLGSRPNGTLFATVSDAQVSPSVLPVQPDLPYILEKMWGVAAVRSVRPMTPNGS